MIFVCEPCVRGASHEKVNSAFLECIRLAYPHDGIRFFADASHIAALKRIAVVDGLDFSGVDFVPLRVDNPEGPFQFVRYASQLRMIFDQALDANVPRILFLSANPAVQFQAKRLQSSARYSGLHFCFVLHAGFEAIATDKVEALPLLPMPGSSQRLREIAREKGLRHVVRAAVRRLASSANIAARGWSWLTRRYLGVRRVMEWRHSDKVSYIALSPHVIANAKQYLDPAALNISAVALPTVFRNFAPHVSTDYVRFAVFGYGNTPMLYSVMTRLAACDVKRRYEVRIIGMDNRGMSRFPHVTAVSPGKFMERHEMEAHVADVDMFLILYDRSRYRLSCSNSIMEALSYRKPILHLRNDCIDSFNNQELPIGYGVEDDAACAELMAEIINNFPSRKVDLDDFSRNIDILRFRYSLVNAASAIRAALQA